MAFGVRFDGSQTRILHFRARGEDKFAKVKINQVVLKLLLQPEPNDFAPPAYFFSRNSRLKILPTLVLGNSVRNSTTLGIL